MTDKELIFERFCELYDDWGIFPISCPIILMKENADKNMNFKVCGKMEKPLTLYAIRKYAKELCNEGYLEKSYCGGQTEDGFAYCTHGYVLTAKAKLSETFKSIRQKSDEYWKDFYDKIDKEINEEFGW